MPEEEYLRLYGKSRDVMVEETKAELRTALKKKDKVLAGKVFEKLKKAYIGDDIFWANEVGTNIFLTVVMALICLILIITIGLSETGVYKFNNEVLIPVLNVFIVIMIAGMACGIYFKGERHWLKYVLMMVLSLVIGALAAFLGFRVVISLTIPVIFSTKYLSAKFTRFIAIFSGLCIMAGTALSAVFGVTADLNYVVLNSDVSLIFSNTMKAEITSEMVAVGEYVRNLMLREFMPNLFQYILISYICCEVANWGHKMMVDQSVTAKEFAKVDAELDLAKDIQTHILPNIFPPFPNKKEIEIFASMEAAKVVGGDFYDFFLVDENHLALVIADVSDKGVPAALFMMIGKALIKNQAMLGKKPSEVLEIVNNQLCENNDAGLFISAWLGILDLRTGEIVAANAGHEFPAVNSGDEYKLVANKKNIVLAGIEDATYKDYTIMLNKGDSLYLYTDGVTEAKNTAGELFGKTRMLESLNRHKGESQEELLHNIRKDMGEFVGEASQSDDITMVGFKFLG